MISQSALPEQLLPRCLDVLRTIQPDERDLIRLAVEVVHELRDEDAIPDTEVYIFDNTLGRWITLKSCIRSVWSAMTLVHLKMKEAPDSAQRQQWLA
jgi:hypothetical protein